MLHSAYCKCNKSALEMVMGQDSNHDSAFVSSEPFAFFKSLKH
jgi:hypothetical protein